MIDHCFCGTPLDKCEDCGQTFCPSCDGECESDQCVDELLDDRLYYTDAEDGEPLTYHGTDPDDEEL